MGESELNNKNETIPIENKHTRDHDYYFDDGNVVILVGDVLFRVHASRLASPSSRNIFTTLPPITSSDDTDPGPVKGSSDNNPIILPEFEPKQFQNFLYVFYGRPIDEKYKQMLEGEKTGTVSEKSQFYMDVAMISHYCDMKDTQLWALRWLKPMLNSTQSLDYTYWTSRRLLQGLSYAKLMNEHSLAGNIRSASGLHTLLDYCSRPEALHMHRPSLPSITMGECIYLRDVLYRNHELRVDDRSLFGQILCIVLQAGHRSLLWTKALTRSERATLFTLQVCLTPLPESLGISSLHSSGQFNKINDNTITCSDACKDSFEFFWKQFFKKNCSQLRSSAPLEGVDALCRLLISRANFLHGTDLPFRDAASGKTFTLCNECRITIREKLDSDIDGIFSKLVDLLEQVERDGHTEAASLDSST